jgi:hypothetical protein
MIVYKRWIERHPSGMVKAQCDGWFLFGIIPIYVRRIGR